MSRDASQLTEEKERRHAQQAAQENADSVGRAPYPLGGLSWDRQIITSESI